MYVAIAVLIALVLGHVMNQLERIFKKSRAAGNAKKLTENLFAKYFCKDVSSRSLFSLYHPSLFSSAIADSKMSPTMSLTRDGMSTNDAKVLCRSEP